MDHLTGLVDRFLGREHNQRRVLELDRLRVLGGTDGRVGDEADIVFAFERSWKVKLSRDRPVLVEAPGEEQTTSLLRNEKFGADGAGKSGILVARVGDQNADGSFATGEKLCLAKNANHR